MLNRCKICDSICPKDAELCDTCLYIEEQEKIEDKNWYEENEFDDES